MQKKKFNPNVPSNNTESRTEYARTYRARYPEKVRDGERRRKLRRLYGISLEEYEEKFQVQQGKCAICRLESKKRLGVDHDHVTGAIRALLCGPCNMALGQLETDDRLERAVAYLARFRTSTPSQQSS